MNPKIFILSPDAKGAIDCTVKKQLLDFLPNRVGSINEADAVIVPVNYSGDYVFNPELNTVPQSKLILLDYLEFYWDWPDDQNNMLGSGNLAKCAPLNTPEYAKLDEWTAQNPPALTFKRECYKAQVSEKVVPISWLCYLPARPLQDKERFDARPIEVFTCFGLSHPDRFRLHGTMFCKAIESGISLFDAWNQEQHMNTRNTMKNEPNPAKMKNWVTIYSPYFTRASIENIMRWQRRAKISVSMPGAGRRCFRDSEAPVDCIMAHQIDSMAWPYPWTSENSIPLRRGYEFNDLLVATQRIDLHEVYLASQENLDKYRPQRFVTEYFMKHLEAAL